MTCAPSKISVMALCVLLPAATFAQTPGTVPSSSTSSSTSTLSTSTSPNFGLSTTTNLVPSNGYRGSVPTGQRTTTLMDLSLADAIRLGLERNLGTLLSDANQRAARGERLIALGRLLPDIHAGANESSQQINLAAYGFPLPAGTPSVVGPFRLFDARAYVSQSLFNLRNLYNKRASDEQLNAVTLDASDARDTIVLVTTALYWDAVAGASRIEAAQAQVAAAQASYQLAEDQRTAGLVPAIDVLRSQVELEAERQRLIASRANFEKQKLNLSQAIGIPAGQPLRLTGVLSFQQVKQLPEEATIDRAYESRKDYQSQAARLKAIELNRAGVSRFRVPTLSLDGDYGVLGSSPASSHGTYSVKVGVNIPIFAGGAEKGALIEADAEVARQQAVLGELKSRIEFEIRSALLDINSIAEQVTTTQNAVNFARTQESQSRDRLAAGVTSTLEVVQAQQSLASANENYIASLYAYNLAKVQLARALGGTEQNLTLWAGEGGTK